MNSFEEKPIIISPGRKLTSTEMKKEKRAVPRFQQKRRGIHSLKRDKMRGNVHTSIDAQQTMNSFEKPI